MQEAKRLPLLPHLQNGSFWSSLMAKRHFPKSPKCTCRLFKFRRVFNAQSRNAVYLIFTLGLLEKKNIYILLCYALNFAMP